MIPNDKSRRFYLAISDYTFMKRLWLAFGGGIALIEVR